MQSLDVEMWWRHSGLTDAELEAVRSVQDIEDHESLHYVQSASRWKMARDLYSRWKYKNKPVSCMQSDDWADLIREHEGVWFVLDLWGQWLYREKPVESVYALMRTDALPVLFRTRAIHSIGSLYLRYFQYSGVDTYASEVQNMMQLGDHHVWTSSELFFVGHSIRRLRTKLHFDANHAYSKNTSHAMVSLFYNTDINARIFKKHILPQWSHSYEVVSTGWTYMMDRVQSVEEAVYILRDMPHWRLPNRLILDFWFSYNMWGNPLSLQAIADVIRNHFYSQERRWITQQMKIIIDIVGRAPSELLSKYGEYYTLIVHELLNSPYFHSVQRVWVHTLSTSPDLQQLYSQVLHKKTSIPHGEWEADNIAI